MEDLIHTFQSVTGASEDESKFFLEANNWDVDAATIAFLDNDGNVGTPPAVHAPSPVASPAITPAPSVSVSAPAAAVPSQRSQAKKPSTSRGGVATLRDVAQQEDHDSDDDDEVQKYYAGGEKSGQMIHYPKEPKKNVVKDVFENAKKMGAKSDNEVPPASSSSNAFGGQGYKLGDVQTPSVALQPKSEKKKDQVVTHTITFWKNGFTVDDGPLRNMTDPANTEFLSDINKGYVPREMAQNAEPGTKFSTDLVDNSQQEWKEPPKPKVVAFSGSGQTLGSTSQPSSTQQKPSATQQAAPQPQSSTNYTGGGNQYAVDEDKPTTSIQLRLHDGTRLVAKFNLTHTVADIRKFVESAKRLGPGQNYDLMLTFPQKVLNDWNQTIAGLGLQNAVIVQKLK